MLKFVGCREITHLTGTHRHSVAHSDTVTRIHTHTRSFLHSLLLSLTHSIHPSLSHSRVSYLWDDNLLSTQRLSIPGDADVISTLKSPQSANAHPSVKVPSDCKTTFLGHQDIMSCICNSTLMQNRDKVQMEERKILR